MNSEWLESRRRIRQRRAVIDAVAVVLPGTNAVHLEFPHAIVAATISPDRAADPGPACNTIVSLAAAGARTRKRAPPGTQNPPN